MDPFWSRDISEIMERWRLSMTYLEEIPMDHLPEEHAVRILMRRDIPRMVRELTRLRPELQSEGSGPFD
jgi:hypothetical protein